MSTSDSQTKNLDFTEVTVKIDDKPVQFTQLELHQSISDHHRFSITVNYLPGQPDAWAIGPDELFKLLGKKVTIHMNHKESGEDTEFFGILTDMEVKGKDGNEGCVVYYGGSPTILLDRDPSLETYVDFDLASTVRSVLDKSGAEINVVNKPVYTGKVPYAARYRETSWAFLCRLLGAYGEWFYYDRDRLVVGNPDNRTKIKAAYDVELLEINIASGIRNLNTRLYNYSPLTNKVVDDTPGTVDPNNRNMFTLVAEKTCKDIYPSVSSLPAPFPVEEYPEMVTAVEAETTRRYSDLSVFTATSRTCAIRLGEIVETSLPLSFQGVAIRELGAYRVTEIIHSVDATGRYWNTFKGIVGMTKYIPLAPIHQPIALPEPATVIDNADPEKMGRVKVKFMWQDPTNDTETTGWLRVQTPDAGCSENVEKGRGFFFIPEIGDQVMIGFEQGSPERPFVMGSLYHKENTQGAAENNTLKSIITSSGHTLEFNDDAEGEWGITIRDGEGNSIRLNTKEKSIEIIAPENLLLTAKNVSINAEENVSIAAQKEITLDSGEKSSYTAQGAMEVLASDDLNVVTEGKLSVEAKGYVTLKGKSIAAEGQAEFSLKGKQTKIEGQKVDVQGAAHKLEIM